MAYVGTYLALTAALFLLFYLTGHAASRRLAPLPPSAAPEERAALRLVAGVAVWVALLFALAAFQRLRPAPIAAVIAACAAWGAWSVWSAAHAAARARRRDADRSARSLTRDPLGVLLAAVLLVMIAALWAQTLRPIVAWDADVYHLTVPRLYLEHGGFRRIPFNVYSNWPLAVQLLFALAMTVKDYILATALHFGFGVALVALVGAVAARAATPLWGAIAAALLLLHPVFLFEIRVAYVDVACAFFLFAAFLALHRALEDRGGRAAVAASWPGSRAACSPPPSSTGSSARCASRRSTPGRDCCGGVRAGRPRARRCSRSRPRSPCSGCPGWSRASR